MEASKLCQIAGQLNEVFQGNPEKKEIDYC